MNFSLRERLSAACVDRSYQYRLRFSYLPLFLPLSLSLFPIKYSIRIVYVVLPDSLSLSLSRARASREEISQGKSVVARDLTRELAPFIPRSREETIIYASSPRGNLFACAALGANLNSDNPSRAAK